MEMRLLSLLARDVLRAMFVSARVFRATTSSSRRGGCARRSSSSGRGSRE